METKNTEDHFYRQLQSLWSVESMLVKAMPDMVEKATNFGLKKSLAFHLAETDQHKVAIEAICKQFGINPQGQANEEMKNILEEGEKTMANQATGKDMDAAIIDGARKVEHYEIEAYKPVADNAEAMGYKGFAQRLRLSMEEERQADNKLSFLTKSFIRPTAKIGDAVNV